MRNVVDEDDIRNFKNEINRLKTSNLLQENLEYFIDGVHELMIAEDLPKLERKLEDLKSLRDTINAFQERASNTFNTLVAKQKIMNDIKDEWKVFDLPLTTDSLTLLQESLSRINRLKLQCSNFNGAFTSEDERKLRQCTRAVQELQAKRGQSSKRLNPAERLTKTLKEAIEKGDSTRLQEAIRICKDNIHNCDLALLSKAEKLLKKVTIKYLKKNLEEATTSRNLPQLFEALQAIEDSWYDFTTFVHFKLRFQIYVFF